MQEDLALAHRLADDDPPVPGPGHRSSTDGPIPICSEGGHPRRGTPVPRAAWIVLAWAGLALCGMLLPQSAWGTSAKVPQPPDGRYGDATVALLYHQRDICDALAGQVLEYWTGLDEMPEDAQEEAVRDFLLERQLSDLAASRTVADLVERFLPQAEGKASSEASSSMKRLFDLDRELCDTVALPVAPREQFQEKVAGLLDRIEVEQEELGRLFVVSDAQIAAALEPYLTYVQMAGIQAEGEYLTYLESIRPKEKGPTIHDRMRAWYEQVYLPGVAPAKQALGAYLKARNSNNPRSVGGACRQLSGKVTPLLRDGSALEAPDTRVKPLLRRAYTDMRLLATACNVGKTREVEVHYRDLQIHLREAAELLSRYGLRP
ncbi:MAG: hypothetical protein MI919_07630 [Holophagales bacterium]|nr:hypothetical protein [Holophagales bacterium]